MTTAFNMKILIQIFGFLLTIGSAPIAMILLMTIPKALKNNPSFSKPQKLILNYNISLPKILTNSLNRTSRPAFQENVLRMY